MSATTFGHNVRVPILIFQAKWDFRVFITVNWIKDDLSKILGFYILFITSSFREFRKNNGQEKRKIIRSSAPSPSCASIALKIHVEPRFYDYNSR